MTIIAFKNRVMAADSSAFIGSHRQPSFAPKIHRRLDGALLGFAGSVAAITMLRPWALGMEGKPQITGSLDEEDFQVLIAYPDGRLARIGPTLVEYPVVSGPYAIGSETAVLLATGAMHAGAHAPWAVGIAIEHSIYVGGEVQIERLDNGK